MEPYYEADGITLYHGDCLEVTEWLAADVLVTDPPYGISWAPKKGGYKGAGSQTLADPVANDANTNVRDEVIRRWGDNPRIVFGSWKADRPNPVDHRLIWHKHHAPLPANGSATQVNRRGTRGTLLRDSGPGDWTRCAWTLERRCDR